MKDQNKISKHNVVFSQWKRKGYAVFASLKKIVKIARLSIDICVSSFCKIKSILRIDKIFENTLDEHDCLLERLSDLTELLLPDFLELQQAVASKNDFFQTEYINNINQSPLFAARG